MSTVSSSLFSISPRSFWNWGRVVLAGALGLGLLIIVYGAWNSVDLLMLFPLAVVGAAVAWILFQYPLVNLGVILWAFAFVMTYTEGFNAIEVVYGIYALGFLLHWFITRKFFYREQILDTIESRTLFLFLVGVTLSIGLSILYGARPQAFLAEWIALLMLGFYFPIKEACTRYRIAPSVFLLILAWIGLFVAVRNGLDYYAGLSNVQHLFQILKNRSIMNVDLMMSIALFYLVFLIYASKWNHRILLLFGFVSALGVLLISQSRAAWACFILTSLLMFLLVEREYKVRMLTLGTLAFGGILIVGFLFFGDLLVLIVSGFIQRAATLGEGAGDFSLRLRFYEAQRALDHVFVNPILGHGLGVPFTYFDAETQRTVERTFIHNGYVSLWYRFGLWGPALFLFFWLRSIWQGFTLFRARHAPTLLRLCGIGAGLSLVAFLISANASNPLYVKDMTFLFALITGLVAGVHERSKLILRDPRPLSS